MQDQDLQTLSHLNEVQIVLDFHFVNNIDYVKTRRVQLKKRLGGQRGPSHLHNKTKIQTIKRSAIIAFDFGLEMINMFL